MYSIEYIQNFINNYKDITFDGLDCVFIPMNEYHGIKIYRHESIRDKCFENQKKVSETNINLAPYVVGGRLTVQHNGYTKYAYITEILPIVIEPESARKAAYLIWKDNIFNETDRFRNERNRVLESVKDITGIYFTDGYICNFGFRGNNLALIDFGN